jgi:integrase
LPQDPLNLNQSLQQPLSDLLIRKLKGGAERIEVWDAKLPGFGVRVSPTGTKSFVLLYRFAGSPRRLTLGRYPVLALAEARQLAREALNQVARGIDPQQGKKRKTAPPSFAGIVEEFVRVHCERRNRGRTRTETARILRFDFVSRWPRRDAQDITRKDVLAVLDSIVERGSPVAANNALSAIRKFFNWCLERGLIEGNPCNAIKKPTKPVARDRVLSDDELRSVWKASEAIGYPFGPLVQLLILTGQRRNEVTSMRWPDIDFEPAIWSIPGEFTKNGKPHLVPLAPAVVARISSLPRLHETLVFPARGNANATFSGFSKLKTRMDELSGVSGWTLHDLRRSAATHLGRLGVAPHVVERILNHASGSFRGVAGVYNRFHYLPEMREGLERWAQHIEQLTGAQND